MISGFNHIDLGKIDENELSAGINFTHDFIKDFNLKPYIVTFETGDIRQTLIMSVRAFGKGRIILSCCTTDNLIGSGGALYFINATSSSGLLRRKSFTLS